MRSPVRQYLTAIAAVAVAILVRLGLDPALYDRIPFVTLFAAVVFTAWRAGRGPAYLTLVAGAVAIDWLVLPPRGSFAIALPEHRVGLVLYAVVGVVLIVMVESLRRGRESLRVTLASIGDGVITTDAAGRVTFLNPVAEALTGWPVADATGRPLGEVFVIVNETTRAAAEDPVTKALRLGKVVGLANHTVLIARDGTERPIDDSAAPILDLDGRAAGCVLVFHDVSEVRRTERRYQLLVEQSADGIFVATPDGRYVDANPAGCAMFGMTRDEVLRSTFVDVLHPDELPRLAGAVADLSTDTVQRSEWRYRRKDGSTFVGELLGRRLPDGRLQGVLRDVTERRRIEEALATSAATLEQIIDHSPFGMYLVDADFRIAVMGRIARQVFASAEPVVGRDLGDALRVLWPEPFALEVIARFRHTLGTGEPYASTRTVGQRADLGRVEAYDWRIERVRMPDGRFGVLCWFYDLTERQDWERRLTAATEAAEIGIHQWNILADSIFWDERIRQWWDVAPGAVITSDVVLRAMHPDDRGRVQELVDAAIDPRGDGRYAAEFRVVVPGRPTRWVRATGRTEFVDGVAISLTGALVDITRHRELEAALREQDRRKDQFLATLSHELRNPLAPIRSAADLLAHEGLPPEQAASAQRIIRRQVGHMARLLDDLLDVARVTQGKMVLRRERVPLATLVDAALETARPAIDARRHQLHVTLPAEPLVLDVDPHRMAQVLANLLTNAARYTEPGGRIDLHAGCEGEGIVIAVRDNGTGLATESLATVFDMFSQVEHHSRDQDGGLGIGLALVRGLVELHGGSVTARSEGRGQGAEFTVRLPASAIAGPGGAPTAADAERRSAGALRILIADDNRDAADSLCELLRLAGHEVRVVYDGRSALGVAEAFRPQVMLLDLGMPDLSGYEVASAVRAQPWARDTRLVAITGWGQESDRAEAQEAGFHEHLVKPVDFRELRSLLARVAQGVGAGA